MSEEATNNRAGRAPGWAWCALGIVYVAVAIGFMAAQPLAAPPDELAHMQYVQFVADHGRLPYFDLQTGGEAGYEGQQPPIYYLIAARLLKLTGPLEARWRWSLVRLLSLACGLVLLVTCRRFFREVLPGRAWLPLIATSVVVLMPTVIFYSSHLTPDIMVLMWSGLVLWLACRARWQPGNLRLAALLGMLCGLGILTKLSAGPLLIVALGAQWGWRREDGVRAQSLGDAWHRAARACR